jgi:tRNA(fMet)-specific endonuclease VapC
MDIVILDTTVASLLHPKKKNSDLRAKYEPHMRGKVLALSFQSVAELWAWAEENRWGDAQRQGLDSFLRRFLVIPYDYELARVWAKVAILARSQGRRLEAGDTWIAATAVHRNIPLLTHDGDYVDLKIEGLKVVSYVPKNAAPG